MYTIQTNVMMVKESTEIPMTSPDHAYEQLKEIANLSQEAFFVLTLNTKNKLIDKHLITLGTVSSSLVHPREVFKPAIMDSASAIIIAHNHPSGDVSPSANDITITKKLVSAGKTLEIPVFDHIIIGRGQNPFTSLRETGLVTF